MSKPFVPYISPNDSPLEMSLRGIVLGAILGIVIPATCPSCVQAGSRNPQDGCQRTLA